MYLILLAVFLIFLTAVLKDCNRITPEKIFGVYTQPGQWYYFKYYTFLILLYIRSLTSKLKKSDSDLASNVTDDVIELEKLKSLSSHPKAFDAVFFHAVNKEGFYLCGGIERRHEGKVNGVFYLVIPGMGLLRSKALPKTTLDADPEHIHSMKAYSGGGMYFAAVEPMKKWKMSYNGKMWLDKPDNLLDVSLEAEFSSKYPYFMFDTGMDKRVLARAIAKEEWSKKYFDDMKAAHQSHYEQMGFLKGHVTVNGNKTEILAQSFRDHSFGHKRDWSLMHRYAYHLLHLEDNTRVCLGVISQPCSLSHIEMGYIVTPKKIIHPVESCDLLLYQHGESGKPGKDIAFTFVANKTKYHVKAITKYECEHFKGNDIEARLIERFLTCEVNGVKGRGISEWHYNNLQ